MSHNQNKYFWVLRLTARTLLKILRTSHAHALTVVDITKPARILLKVFRKSKRFPAVFNKITPRDSVAGPVLNLCDVRNDKGEVISLHIYHEILHVRRRILEKVLENYEDFGFLKRYRRLHSIGGYLGLRIAVDVRHVVYLAHYARWKQFPGEDHPDRKNILIIPKSQWSNELIQYGETIIDQVLLNRREKSRLARLWHVFKYAAAAFIRRSGASPQPRYDHDGGKIMMTYSTGLLHGQRNDFNYFHAAKIDPKRMFVFFRVPKYPPTQEELDWLKEKEISSVAAPSFDQPIPGIPVWKESPRFMEHRKRFARMYFDTLKECIAKRRGHGLWLLEQLWDLGKELTYWIDFFVENKVSILVNPNPSEYNFIPDLAMTHIGGFAVEAERSIRFDYCTYMHNSPNHINFVTGSYSLTQIPEPSLSLATVQTGALNVAGEYPGNPDLQELKKQGKKIITIFDETANDVFFGQSISQLYNAVIQMCRQDKRLFFYIKTKKDDILEGLPELRKEILQLQEEGSCQVTDWKVSAPAAAHYADLVISVPSTAAFESVLNDTPTIVFNPMKAGNRIFYGEDRLNRRVFEDPETMIAAIIRWADGKNPSLGDCKDIYAKIDPYPDKNGAGRIGEYLKYCLKGFDDRLDTEDIIQQANDQFAAHWGKDKITRENSFETQIARKYYQTPN